MIPHTYLRKSLVQAAELISEAGAKQVQGMSSMLQTVLRENEELHILICKEQERYAKLEMDNINYRIQIAELDDTIVALISGE